MIFCIFLLLITFQETIWKSHNLQVTHGPRIHPYHHSTNRWERVDRAPHSCHRAELRESHASRDLKFLPLETLHGWLENPPFEDSYFLKTGTFHCHLGFRKCNFIHAAPRQGPPAPRSQGVISASVVVAPGQIFYATIIQKPCI